MADDEFEVGDSDPGAGPIDDIPDDAREAELLEVEEHVSDILFDAGSQYEADCLLCKRAVELGVFARYGFDVEEL